jgi:predicted RNA-binding Zn-ribbon protein involved in translation (DUF1610 family)
MGKEIKEQQRASTFECAECGAIVAVSLDRLQGHHDIPCPATGEQQEAYDIPEYCKNLPKK